MAGPVLDEVLLRSLRAMQQSVAISDVSRPDEPLVWVNDAFTQATGYLATESVGRNCRFLQKGLDQEGYDTSGPARAIRELITRRRGGTVVIPNRHRDGRVFHNELSLSPLVEASGEVRYYVAVQRDISTQVGAQRARDTAHTEAAELAAQLQRQLVPQRLPVVSGYEVAVRYEPATRADGSRGEVSGDFYDLRVLADGGVLAVIGDVSGRGPRAAATTAALRWAVRGLAGAVTSPAELLRLVGEAVHDALDDRFATIAAVRLPTAHADADATIALAGHPQLVLRPAGGAATFVGEPGMLLGPFPDVDLHDTSLVLSPGDIFVLYTDGVTEAADHRHELLGDERLLAAVDALPHDEVRADGVADAVLAAVQRHVGDGPTDDLTLMVVRRTA